MHDPIHRAGLPYGAILTHGYPRPISLLATALCGLVIGIVLGVAL